MDLFRLLKKLAWLPLVVAPAYVLLFLFSCSSNEIEWDKKRCGGGFVAIVNDSMALLTTRRCYSSESENFAGTTGENGCTHHGLHLVNYRKKQPPFWSDTLNYAFYSINYDDFRTEGQWNDSAVYSWRDETYRLWKIGFKPIEKKVKSTSYSCGKGFSSNRIRTWSDSRFFMPYRKKMPPGGDTCQYALFDIITGHREEHRFAGELSWLAETECDDIRYMAGQMVCLRRNVDDECTIDLLAGGELKSTLVIEPCDNSSLQIYEILWYGDYVGVEMRGGDMDYTVHIYKVITPEFVFDGLYRNVAHRKGFFINNDGDTIRYDVNVDLNF